jgi:DNA-binding response OmpR family regulator
VVVTDIVMPGMGGPELYRRLRDRRPGVRVLSETLDRDDFLPTPYTPAELARRVRALPDGAAVS